MGAGVKVENFSSIICICASYEVSPISPLTPNTERREKERIHGAQPEQLVQKFLKNHAAINIVIKQS
jgi:hypothetical protein